MKTNAFINIGSDFIAHLIAGGLLGYGVDRFFDTKPLFMIILIILGFAGACFSLHRRLKSMTDQDK